MVIDPSEDGPQRRREGLCAGAGTGSGSGPDAGARIRILIVEDEEMIRSMLVRLAALEGWDCEVAESAAEARVAFEQDPARFDLLITDVMMPGESGVQLYRHLATIRPDLPVLFMSGFSEDRLAGLGRIEAPHAFLDKPFRRQRLIEMIERVLAGR